MTKTEPTYKFIRVRPETHALVVRLAKETHRDILGTIHWLAEEAATRRAAQKEGAAA